MLSYLSGLSLLADRNSHHLTLHERQLKVVRVVCDDGTRLVGLLVPKIVIDLFVEQLRTGEQSISAGLGVCARSEPPKVPSPALISKYSEAPSIAPVGPAFFGEHEGGAEFTGNAFELDDAPHVEAKAHSAPQPQRLHALPSLSAAAAGADTAPVPAVARAPKAEPVSAKKQLSLSSFFNPIRADKGNGRAAAATAAAAAASPPRLPHPPVKSEPSSLPRASASSSSIPAYRSVSSAMSSAAAAVAAAASSPYKSKLLAKSFAGSSSAVSAGSAPSLPRGRPAPSPSVIDLVSTSESDIDDAAAAAAADNRKRKRGQLQPARSASFVSSSSSAAATVCAAALDNAAAGVCGLEDDDFAMQGDNEDNVDDTADDTRQQEEEEEEEADEEDDDEMPGLCR